jgi:iron complex outermembrane recepter protein
MRWGWGGGGVEVNQGLVKSMVAACALCIATTAAVGQAGGPSAPAATPGVANDTGGLAEIVVTAQKREENLQDVGITVNVATKLQLQNAGVTDIHELAKVVPSFTVTSNFDAIPQFSIRGLVFTSNQLSASPTVSTYIDEAPLPYSSMTGGAFLDLERVEVLKGPQGTLFGNNATGGSINFIAAKPTNYFSTGFTATTDRFGQFSGEGFVSGPLSGTVNARLAVSTTQGGDWQHTYTPGPFLESGAANKGAVRLLLDWHPSDKLKISLNLNSYYNDSDPVQFQFAGSRPEGGPGTGVVVPPYGSVETYPLPPHDDRAADFTNPGSTSNTFYQSVLRTDYDLSDALTLTSLTNFAHLRTSIDRQGDGTRIDILDLSHDGTIQTYGEEVRLTGDLKDLALHFITGLNYSHDIVDEEEPITFNHFSIFPPDFVTNPESNFTSETTAGFANAEWNATNQITLLGGARYTVNHLSDSYCLPSGSPEVSAFFGGLANTYRAAGGLGPTDAYQVGTCTTVGPAPEYLPYAFNQASTDHNVSWRAGANYHVTPDLMLYALVSRGFKAGAYAFETAIIASELAKVKQEEVTSYESGIKYQLSNMLTVSAAGYYYDYVNKQAFTSLAAPLVGSVQSLINIPKSKAYGFDADATLVPIRGLTLHGALTNTRTSITDPGQLTLDGFGQPVNYVGHTFAYAPKWSAIFDTEYRKPLFGNIEGLVGASSYYESDESADLSNEPIYNIPSHITFDARVGLAGSTGWTATAWVRNIANKYYINDINYTGDSFVSTTGMPRNFGVTLTYRLGGPT